MTSAPDLDVDLDDAVVVGLDGSWEADLAVDWGCRQARLEGRPLVLLHATGLPLAAPTGRRSGELLRAAKYRLRRTEPDLDVHIALVGGPARSALLDASTRASLVVVGARGKGGATSILHASVAGALAKAAGCPVVVVRRRPQARYDAVLVGTDGTAVSEPALGFAFRVAAARSLPVTVLHCFWDDTGRTGDVSDGDAGADEQRAALESIAAPHRHRHPEVTVDLLLSRGFADQRLVAASRDYELVVLGHHRLHPLDALVWGNVTPLVVRHATSDLAVVPYRPDDPRDHRP
jgi:nucleotide-binding universal stress UspA family protein